MPRIDFAALFAGNSEPGQTLTHRLQSVQAERSLTIGYSCLSRPRAIVGHIPTQLPQRWQSPPSTMRAKEVRDLGGSLDSSGGHGNLSTRGPFFLSGMTFGNATMENFDNEEFAFNQNLIVLYWKISRTIQKSRVRVYPSQFGISFSLEADWGRIWKLRLSQPTAILKYCEDWRLSIFQRWP